jgi:DNA-directed RNA polymerase specialized sigma24 family protein
MDTCRVGLSGNGDEYELFRRAIVERDEDAWAAIYVRYRTLMISWSHRCGAALLIGEHYDDIADQAFARAWMALSPRRFARFPNLSKLLAYLRTCVMAVVIDCSRAQQARERALLKLEARPLATPEQIVLEEIERSALWQLISKMAETIPERIVLVESFVLELPPRVILARHPDLFSEVANIYFAKRNVLARLQRNPDLQQLREELLWI